MKKLLVTALLFLVQACAPDVCMSPAGDYKVTYGFAMGDCSGDALQALSRSSLVVSFQAEECGLQRCEVGDVGEVCVTFGEEGPIVGTLTVDAVDCSFVAPVYFDRVD